MNVPLSDELGTVTEVRSVALSNTPSRLKSIQPNSVAAVPVVFVARTRTTGAVPTVSTKS